MSKQSERRVIFGRRRHQDPDQSPGKSRWWRRRRPSAGDRFKEALTHVGPASVNRPVDGAASARGRRQVDARREQQARGNRIREWLQGRLQEAQKREKARRRAERRRSRGTDRVPKQFRDVARPTTWVRRHEPTQHPATGLWVKGMPYRNPDRIQRLEASGRLRPDDPAGQTRRATPIATGRRTRKAGPHPWRARLHAARSGGPATPNADARRAAR